MNTMNKQTEKIRQANEHIAWMENKKGRNHPLSTFREWMKKAGLSQRSEDWNPICIHVAGTNGKGSLCRWLSDLIMKKGKRVGVFTSPHLISHTERIQIDQSPIDLLGWDQIFNESKDFFEKKELTMFEMDLWMSLVYFSQTKPDVIIMETGLGGQRDATTALDYDLCLITNIGLDHMTYLGNTIEEIAQAKAGILIENTPAGLGRMDASAKKVIQKQAKIKKVPLFEVTDEQVRQFFSKHPQLDRIFRERMLPDYQKENFILALEAMKQLGYGYDDPELQDLASRFFWPGRFTILKNDPLIAADGAHNPHGIRALCESLKPGEFDQVYFSVLADKQAITMIELLKKKVPSIILVDFDTPRIAELIDLSTQCSLPVCSYETMLENLKKTDQNTLICGSLYFVGDLLRDF